MANAEIMGSVACLCVRMKRAADRLKYLVDFDLMQQNLYWILYQATDNWPSPPFFLLTPGYILFL